MRGSVARLGKNAIEMLSKLEGHGVGARIARKGWVAGSHWDVKDVRVAKAFGFRVQPAHVRTALLAATQDGKHGDVYGQLTWQGREAAKTRVRGVLKKDWMLVGAAAAASPSAASTLLREEAKAAAGAAGAAGATEPEE